MFRSASHAQDKLPTVRSAGKRVCLRAMRSAGSGLATKRNLGVLVDLIQPVSFGFVVAMALLGFALGVGGTAGWLRSADAMTFWQAIGAISTSLAVVAALLPYWARNSDARRRQRGVRSTAYQVLTLAAQLLTRRKESTDATPLTAQERGVFIRVQSALASAHVLEDEEWDALRKVSDYCVMVDHGSGDMTPDFSGRFLGAVEQAQVAILKRARRLDRPLKQDTRVST